jgi:glycosyltransferase A (GT-A) superfamily protein (DUF2064 family)
MRTQRSANLVGVDQLVVDAQVVARAPEPRAYRVQLAAANADKVAADLAARRAEAGVGGER